MQDRFVNWPEVQKFTGKSRTTIWRWERDGLFPKSHKIGPNSRAWKSSSLEKWLANKCDQEGAN